MRYRSLTLQYMGYGDKMNIRRWDGNKKIKLIKLRIARRVIDMAILAKGKPIMFGVKQERAKDFIKECNDNVISKPFIEECKQASKLFRKIK